MGTTSKFDELRTAYLASRRVAANTRRLYGAALKRYAEWAATQRLDPLELTVPDVLGFIEYAQRGRSPMYATKLVGITSNFFGWLFAEGHIPSDPWASAQKPPYVRELRDALSLDEARRLLRTDGSASDRAVVALFLVNCLRVTEASNAKVQDLDSVEGYPVLRLPSRARDHSLRYTVLPEVTAGPIREVVGSRTHGPLLLSNWGTPMSQQRLARAVHRIATRAGIERRVSPAVLTATMREIALSEGVSFAAVMRAVPEIEMRDLTRRAVRLDSPPSLHAAIQMERILLENIASSASLLSQAERIVDESDMHPAAAVMLAGATLERHLREMAERFGVTVGDTRRAKLSTYASALRSHGHISEKDVQLAAAIEGDRNMAAHGWFDTVTTSMATAVVDQVRDFIRRRADGARSAAGT